MATGKLAGVTRIEMLHHHFPRSPVRCSTWRPTATATFRWKQNPRQWQWRWNVHDRSVGQPQTLLAHRSARIEWCLPGRYRFSKRKSGIIGYTTHANSDLLWTSGLIHTPWLFHLKLPSTANEPGSCDLHIWRWRSQLSQAKRRRLSRLSRLCSPFFCGNSLPHPSAILHSQDWASHAYLKRKAEDCKGENTRKEIRDRILSSIKGSSNCTCVHGHVAILQSLFSYVALQVNIHVFGPTSKSLSAFATNLVQVQVRPCKLPGR